MPYPMRYFPLPPLDEKKIAAHKCFLLFETSLCGREDSFSYIFFDPLDSVRARVFSHVPAAFSRIERYAKSGYWLAGYFSYELGYFFENFKGPKTYQYPLVNLCVFSKAFIFDHKTGRFLGRAPDVFGNDRRPGFFSVKNPRLSISRKKYAQAIKRIHGYIRRGQTYQVNFTNRLSFDFRGSAFSFYESLKSRQSVPFSSFCKFRGEYVLSLSPELFFRRQGSLIWSRPMKGTIKRGRGPAEEKRMAEKLHTSAKDRAENLMVVDLIRNDLGRVCRPGSIRVPALFEVEKYNTLHQMTSTVRGVLNRDAAYLDIFKAIFPGGSVTGAPKIRTMEIIRGLETGTRGIYCGALGMIMPGEKAVFNLPIRTLSLRKGKGRMGIGSGIVWDSKASLEFEECLLKARFFTEGQRPFSLFETMLWERGTYCFLKDHLARLKISARYFGFPFKEARILRALKRLSADFKPGAQYRIRVLLASGGKVSLQQKRFVPYAGTARIAISEQKTDPRNLFLYHKTTNRSLYDSEYEQYLSRGFFDVIFLNGKNEVTEGAISNIIIEKGGTFYTPPVTSGLLPGIMRHYLLKNRLIQEKKIYPEDLFLAKRILLCNSVRGLTHVRL